MIEKQFNKSRSYSAKPSTVEPGKTDFYSNAHYLNPIGSKYSKKYKEEKDDKQDTDNSGS